MFSPKEFYDFLKKNDINFFTGVPDSLLKNFCSYIIDNCDENNHIIAANEGNAVALGIGYHLSTNKLPVVYLQNSGLGNIINPLLSLADKDVYSIPMILLIGWRGEPGVKDEPQHKKQGRVMIDMLITMEIPHEILLKDDTNETFFQKISKIINESKNNNKPCALVVQKGFFSEYKKIKNNEMNFEMNRETLIESIIEMTTEDDYFVTTTGVTSREFYECMIRKNKNHEKNFYTVGGMGHASQIALSIAIQKKENRVFCIDGDGSVIMHMGSLPIIGNQKCRNFKHIVFNNGCHESVGGQPTVGFNVNLTDIAKASNYDYVISVENTQDFKKYFEDAMVSKGSVFFEIKIKPSHRPDLGRPSTSPEDNKSAMMKSLTK